MSKKISATYIAVIFYIIMVKYKLIYTSTLSIPNFVLTVGEQCTNV